MIKVLTYKNLSRQAAVHTPAKAEKEKMTG